MKYHSLGFIASILMFCAFISMFAAIWTFEIKWFWTGLLFSVANILYVYVMIDVLKVDRLKIFCIDENSLYKKEVPNE